MSRSSSPARAEQLPGQPPTPVGVHIERVSIKPPAFWKNDPKLWFHQLEAQFQIAGIVQDLTKYNYVVSAIDTEVLQHISECLTNPPETDRYGNIKERLIRTFSDSQERQLRKLLSEIELGDKKPSQLLNEMNRLGGSAVSKELLKTLWLQRLPTNIQSVLAASTDTIENLAQMADKISEIQQPAMSSFAISTNTDITAAIQRLSLEVAELKVSYGRSEDRRRSRSRSQTPNRNNKVCWYHRKFKENARRCTTPCEFRNATENITPRQ